MGIVKGNKKLGFIDIALPEIKKVENDGGNFGPYYDSSVALGYGFDLLTNSIADINNGLSAAGIDELTSEQIQRLEYLRSKKEQFKNDANAFKKVAEEEIPKLGISVNPDQADLLIRYSLNESYSKDLEDRLQSYGVNLADLPSENIKASLLSLVYNGGKGIIGDNLGGYLYDMLQGGDESHLRRADAWLEIRYQSNGNRYDDFASGIQDRRYKESNFFGLYDPDIEVEKLVEIKNYLIDKKSTIGEWDKTDLKYTDDIDQIITKLEERIALGPTETDVDEVSATAVDALVDEIAPDSKEAILNSLADLVNPNSILTIASDKIFDWNDYNKLKEEYPDLYDELDEAQQLVPIFNEEGDVVGAEIISSSLNGTTKVFGRSLKTIKEDGEVSIKTTFFPGGYVNQLGVIPDSRVELEEGVYGTKTREVYVTKELENGDKVTKKVGDFGQQFGSSIGKLISWDNQFQEFAGGVLLSAIGKNIEQGVALYMNESSFDVASKEAIDGFGADVKSIGASTLNSYISSLITAELMHYADLDGETAAFASTVTGAYVSSVVTQLATTQTVTLDGLSEVDIGNVVATYVGKRIAQEYHQPETKEGAILSSIGASIGATVGSAIPVVGTVIGAAIGAYIGGVVGDLFGSTPRAGAELIFDADTGEFEVTNVWRKSDGSRSQAEQLATMVSDSINSVVETIGGEIVGADGYSAGTFGHYGSKLTYNVGDGSKRTKDAGTLIANGVLNAIDDLKVAGGNVFVKRAVYNRVDDLLAKGDLTGDALSSLLGSLNIASEYQFYVENSDIINLEMGLNPNSAFTHGWNATLSEARAQNLLKRQTSDHFGGWQHLIEKEYAQEFNSLSESPELGLYNSVSFSYGTKGALEREITVQNHDGSSQFIHDFVNGGVKTEIDFTSQQNLEEILSSDYSITVAGEEYSGEVVSAVINGTEGNDVIESGDLGNDVFGGEGNDTLRGGAQADWLIGEAGDDKLYAGGGNNNALFGEEGTDDLYGAGGSDWLDGGEGHDDLYGKAGNDVLDGGFGNDNLQGGAGNDTYLFKRGDGQDTISDFDPNFNQVEAGKKDITGSSALGSNGDIAGGFDAIEFGAGISLNDINVKLDKAADTFTITLLDENGEKTTDTITIANWSDKYQRIEKLQFADGQSIQLTNIESFITGTSGNDTLTGTNGADFIHGGIGDDEIRALAGDDVAIGGLGNDNVSGDQDNDLVVGGDGNDNLYGGAGDDIVTGDAGDDSLAGGLGNDVLAGGAGDDTIVTGFGDDTVIFGHGDGKDTLVDGYFGDDDVIGEFTWGDGLILDPDYTFNGSNDTIAIYDYENGRMADGFAWQFDEETQRSYIIQYSDKGESSSRTQADLGQDVLELKVGTSLDDLRVKKDGNDLLLGLEGQADLETNFADLDDTIRIKNWFSVPGASIETLRIFGIDDIDLTSIGTFIGGDNNDDSFTGTAAVDWVTSGGGQDTVRTGAGNDFINGGSSNDVIEGGSGADIMFGGHGEDTLSYASSNEGVEINLSATELNERAKGGDAEGDVYDGFEHVTGSEHDDVITGDAGENIIDAGKGADVVAGGAGNDTYIFNKGDGTLRIKEFGQDADIEMAGEDSLEFGDDITPADLNFDRVGDDLQIRLENSTDTIIFENWFLDDSYQVEYLVFPSGGVMDIRYHAFVDGESYGPDWVQGTNADDTLFSKDGNDIVSGRNGNDILNGGDDQDVLIGGEGADVLNGGSGKDTAAYYDSEESVLINLAENSAIGGTAQGDTFNSIENVVGSEFADTLTGDRYNNTINAGRGNDTVNGGSGADTLHGGSGNDTVEGGSGTDTILGNSGTDTLNGGLGNDLIDGGEHNDTIDGNQGNDILLGGTGDDTINGGAGDDEIRGGLGDDELSGNSGKDSVYAGNGDDLVDGGAGDDVIYGEQGDDELRGSEGQDYISGGMGSDKLFGDSEADVLKGGQGDDSLEGGAGDDTLVGGQDNDTLKGEEGDDFLIGGAGDDTLIGGTGTDYYVFSGDFGHDVIREDIDRTTLDEIIFSGIKSDQLWFEEDGQDLLISIIGTENQVRVENFARFRINTDENNQITDQIAEALSEMSPVKSVQVDGSALSLEAINNILDVMSNFEKPSSVDGNPILLDSSTDKSYEDYLSELLETQSDSWQETEITALESRVEFAPVFGNRAFTLLEDTELTGSLRATDQNPDDYLTYQVLTQPRNGELVIDETTGDFVFTPNENFYGEQLAKVMVTDSSGKTDTAVIRFSVEADDDPFDVANDVLVKVAEDEVSPGNSLGFEDVDNLLSDYELTHDLDPAFGSVEFHEDGSFTFFPAANVSGITDFAITIKSPSGEVKTVNVRAEVSELNDRPQSPAEVAIQTEEGGTVTGTIPFTDADQFDNHSFAVISESGNGQIEIDSQGNFTIDYSGNDDFFGQDDTYVVAVTDDSGAESRTAIKVDVAEVNDAPTDIVWNVGEDLAGVEWDEGVPTISEDSSQGMIVGKLLATDPDVNPEFKINVFDANNDDAEGRFTIDPNTGEIRVGETALDVPLDDFYEIQVTVTDKFDESLNYTQTLKINVLNEIEVPELDPNVQQMSEVISEFDAWNGYQGTSTHDDVVVSAQRLESVFNGVDDTSQLKIKSGNDLGVFAIQDGNLVVLESKADKLNWEDSSRRKHRIGIVAENAAGESEDQFIVEVNLSDVEEDPRVVYLYPLGIVTDPSTTGSVGQSGFTFETFNDGEPAQYWNQRIIDPELGYVGSIEISVAPSYDPPFGPVAYFYDLVDGFSQDGAENENRIYLRKDWNHFYYNGLTPISFDLNNDGLNFTQQGSVLFDVDSDGNRETTAWVGSEDGMLALDRNGNGTIDNGSEISFVDDLEGASTDLEGLVAFDSNSDGVFDARDERFSEFLVWQDKNQNGVSEGGELSSLMDAGITSINLTPKPNSESTGVEGVHLLNTSTFTWADGSQSALGDVRFMFNEIDETDPQYVDPTLGSGAADQMLGTVGQDHIQSLSGDDVVFASEGNDLVKAGTGNDLVSGGKGDDQLFGEEGEDKLIGGFGNDQLSGGGMDDQLFGGKGNDQLSGDEGNDELFGNEGGDALLGGTGDDTLYGESGSDYLDGGTGNDVVSGGVGDDYLVGGVGDDLLLAGSGDDVLAGGTGNDLIEGTSGNNQIVFTRGDGQDQVAAINSVSSSYELFVYGISEQDVRFKSDGSSLQVLLGEYLDDDNQLHEEFIVFDGIDVNALFQANSDEVISLKVVSFEDGISWDAQKILEQIYLDINPTIVGTNSDDQLAGTDSTELIEAYDGDDQVDAKDGDDQVYGYKGNDQLVGGLGDDILDGGIGNDQLIGEAGDDRLFGQDGSDELIGGEGADRIYGGNGDDTLSGGIGEDVLHGEAGADRIAGGAGNDIVDGGAGNDFIEGGDGADELRGGADDDTLVGGLGDDQISGDQGDDLISGGLGSDLLNGGAGDDIVEGGDGVDMLVGEAGNDQLSGGAGNDYLFGDKGNDTLDGGFGDDYLVGGAGNDLYKIDSQGDIVDEKQDDGIDTLESAINIDLSQAFNNIENVTLVGAATEAIGSDISNHLIGNDLGNILNGKAGADMLEGQQGDDVYVVDHSGDQVVENADHGIDTVISSIDYVLGENTENLQLQNNATTGTGNELDNVIEGNQTDNRLFGLDGDDTINGGAGNDHLDGGWGDDALYAGLGDDLLKGGLGADTLVGGLGDDLYYVDSQDDRVVEHLNQGSDKVISSVDYTLGDHLENVRITGDAIKVTGNQLSNTIDANSNDNVIYAGDGDDRIIAGEGDDFISTAGGVDTLVYSKGDGHDELAIASGNYQLELHSIRRSEAEFKVIDNKLVLAFSDTDSITFNGFSLDDSEDTLKLNQVQFINNGVTETLDSDEVVAWVESFFATHLGDESNNFILGSLGEDRIHGLGGDDTIVALMGDDTLLGGKGNDILTAGLGNDRLLGGDGRDKLLGNLGQDSLDGGKGSDKLLGGLGDDVYTFEAGDGEDWLLDGLGNDTIQFNGGVKLDDIWLERDGIDLIVHYTNNDKVIVEHGFTNGILGIDQIAIGDNVHSLHDLIEQEKVRVIGDDRSNFLVGGCEDNVIFAGGGHDTIKASHGDDLILAGDGNDRLYGGDGNDVLKGEAGCDVLNGGYGRDTYVIGSDQGHDVIYNRDVYSSDRIVFEQGISFDDVEFTRSKHDLTIRFGEDQSVTVDKWFISDRYQVEAVDIEGVVLTNSIVDQLIQGMSSGSGKGGMDKVSVSISKDEAVELLAASTV